MESIGGFLIVFKWTKASRQMFQMARVIVYQN